VRPSRCVCVCEQLVDLLLVVVLCVLGFARVGVVRARHLVEAAELEGSPAPSSWDLASLQAYCSRVLAVASRAHFVKTELLPDAADVFAHAIHSRLQGDVAPRGVPVGEALPLAGDACHGGPPGQFPAATHTTDKILFGMLAFATPPCTFLHVPAFAALPVPSFSQLCAVFAFGTFALGDRSSVVKTEGTLVCVDDPESNPHTGKRRSLAKSFLTYIHEVCSAGDAELNL
jgi:hypothetical protein